MSNWPRRLERIVGVEMGLWRKTARRQGGSFTEVEDRLKQPWKGQITYCYVRGVERLVDTIACVQRAAGSVEGV